LFDEDLALDFAGREIVMIIETDFADGHDFWMAACQRAQVVEVSGVTFAASCGWTPTVA
jgi:hypothetical protein